MTNTKQELPIFENVELRGAFSFPAEAKAIYSHLQPGDHLLIIPEPTNRFDRYALLIADADNEISCCYIQRPINESIARLMDKGVVYQGVITKPYAVKNNHHARFFPLTSRPAKATTETKTKQPIEA